MKDFQDRMEKLRLDAIDCDLIAKLATNDEKRKAFEILAEQYRSMALALKDLIAHKINDQMHAMVPSPSANRRRSS